MSHGDSWKASASKPSAISIDMDNLVDERAVTADLVAAAHELLHDSSIQRLDLIDRRIVEGLAVGRSRSELLDTTGLNYPPYPFASTGCERRFATCWNDECWGKCDFFVMFGGRPRSSSMWRGLLRLEATNERATPVAKSVRRI